jgi:hypothetical protein
MGDRKWDLLAAVFGGVTRKGTKSTKEQEGEGN